MKELPFTIEFKMLMHGIAGAFVRVLVLREWSWPDGIISLTVGAITAPYVGPAISPFIEKVLSVQKEDALPLSGFIAGVAGVMLIGGILDYTRAKMKGVKDESSKTNGK